MNALMNWLPVAVTALWGLALVILAVHPIDRRDRICLWVSVGLGVLAIGYVVLFYRPGYLVYLGVIEIILLLPVALIVPLYLAEFSCVLLSAFHPARFTDPERCRKLSRRGLSYNVGLKVGSKLIIVGALGFVLGGLGAGAAAGIEWATYAFLFIGFVVIAWAVWKAAVTVRKKRLENEHEDPESG
ncbi:MAG: hypothetical protein ACOC7S_02915 [Planctomycetota bacterium]